MTNKGFTLVELLVVVLIIGILSSVALPQYTKAVEKARATEAIALLGTLARAEKVYLGLRNTYTDDLAMLDFTAPGASGDEVDGFSTKNFTFKVSRATVSTFMAYAERRNQTGNDVYTIVMAIRKDGNVITWCLPAAASTLPRSGDWTTIPSEIENITGTENNAKICKAIADGDTKGIIK